tara:strand:+ start:1567 stop:2646 length:1080 start_codon:yes stop_codon:yes gene_type:complete
MSARKADERYDAKEAYNKNLSGKARLHYLENDIHDKGMSMKAPMDMKSPMDMGHMSAAKMKTPMEMGHSPAEMGHKSPADFRGSGSKKKEYSFGEKLIGTAKNIKDYATSKIKGSKTLDGIGVTNPQGFDFVRKDNLKKSKAASDRAAKRKKEGSAFFMESEGQEKKDLMKYNPIDDRAGSPAEANIKNLLGKRGRDLSQKAIDRKVKKGKGRVEYKTGGGFQGVGKPRKPGHAPGEEFNRGVYVSNKGKRHSIKKKNSPINKSPMYDKGHEGDQDGHVHPRTQGEVDVMNKHGQALNKFISKVKKFGPMSDSQMKRVNDKINALQGQYIKTRDSIGNVHKQFDLKRDQEFEDLFGDGK